MYIGEAFISIDKVEKRNSSGVLGDSKTFFSENVISEEVLAQFV